MGRKSINSKNNNLSPFNELIIIFVFSNLRCFIKKAKKYLFLRKKKKSKKIKIPIFVS